MSKFLYGLSVQGIGEYIFSSNALKEIIGASELIKNTIDEIKDTIDKTDKNMIDKTDKEIIGAKNTIGKIDKEIIGTKNTIDENDLNEADKIDLKAIFGLENEPPEVILSAAGHLRVIFENEADLKKIVREMPKFIAKKAGDIAVAQAVVEFEENSNVNLSVNSLENSSQNDTKNSNTNLSQNLYKASSANLSANSHENLSQNSNQNVNLQNQILNKNDTEILSINSSQNDTKNPSQNANSQNQNSNQNLNKASSVNLNINSHEISSQNANLQNQISSANSSQNLNSQNTNHSQSSSAREAFANSQSQNLNLYPLDSSLCATHSAQNDIENSIANSNQNANLQSQNSNQNLNSQNQNSSQNDTKNSNTNLIQNYKNAVQELENRLKIQRNKPQFSQNYAFSILQKYPKSAKPIFCYEQNGKICVAKNDDKDRANIDKTTLLKLKAFKKFNEKNPNSINDLQAISNEKNKIALIYADGNALGEIVRNLDKNEMREFSQRLDSATKTAFKNAKNAIKQDLKDGENSTAFCKIDGENQLKIREVICGGDDLVVICDANIALKLAQNFLREFELQTKDILKTRQKLTACAGVAFSQHKYPIHYSLKLAKDLMKRAKIQSKKLAKNSSEISCKNLIKNSSEIPPSSLFFHNIQSSAVQSFTRFIEQELTLGKDKPVQCDFGAYYLSAENSLKNLPTIENLLNLVQIFRDENAPTARLRQWLTMLDLNRNLADKELDRICEIYDGWATSQEPKFKALHSDLSLKNLIVQKDDFNKKPIYKTPIYDVIAILSTTAELF